MSAAHRLFSIGGVWSEEVALVRAPRGGQGYLRGAPSSVGEARTRKLFWSTILSMAGNGTSQVWWAVCEQPWNRDFNSLQFLFSEKEHKMNNGNFLNCSNLEFLSCGN